jgi:hypothetical protein
MRGVKQHYETIDEAWLSAFAQFAWHGAIMTPYRCLPTKITRSGVRTIPHPNPWAFRSWLSRLILHDLRRRQCCGGYHLTRRSSGFILSSMVIEAPDATSTVSDACSAHSLQFQPVDEQPRAPE